MARPNVERRQHQRYALECPLRLTDAGGGVLATGRGINVSDGGMLFPVPPDAAPRPGAEVHLSFSLPRSTPNTFLLEEIDCPAVVVREEPSDAPGPVRVAVRFERPLDLAIEV